MSSQLPPVPGGVNGFFQVPLKGWYGVCGSEIRKTHQLKWGKYPVIYKGFMHPRFVWDFFHQQ